MADSPKTILYFGIFDPNFSRNKVYAEGLRRHGFRILTCTDSSRGLVKYWKLFQKHWKLRSSYDAMIVGFPGYVVVPFAKLIAKRGKPVVFDALCSFYETQIISRNAYQGNLFRIPYVRTIDWLATRCADKVLVETEAQKKYFESSLGVQSDKVVVTYTGVDDTLFGSMAPDQSAQSWNSTSARTSDAGSHSAGQADRSDASAIETERSAGDTPLTVLFRGRITREAGATTVLKAAKILEKSGVNFLIIGFGWGEAIEEFAKLHEEIEPDNVRWIQEQVPPEELVRLMRQSDVSLGQFADNERLLRTIPHKVFESLLMKIPIVTSRAGGVSEVLTDGKDCLMSIPDDAQDLADKIMKLKNDPALRTNLAEAGYGLYQERFMPEKIVQPIIDLIPIIS